MIQKDDEQIGKARAKDKEEVKGAADSIVKKKTREKKQRASVRKTITSQEWKTMQKKEEQYLEA